MKRVIIKKHIILAIILMTCFGCGLFKKEAPPPPMPAPTPEPTHVYLKLETAGNINPNIAGRASPLVVRIYHLKSYAAFKSADFNELYKKDQEVLGNDLVDKKELHLKPNEKLTFFYEGIEDVGAIGVMAAFRYYEQSQWKAAATVRKGKTTIIDVLISDTTVSIK